MVVLSTRQNQRRGCGRVAVRLELRPRVRLSRVTTRAHKLLVHVPAALWKCWDPSYWWTYQRRCVLGPLGSTQERAPPLGNQPENWWAE